MGLVVWAWSSVLGPLGLVFRAWSSGLGPPPSRSSMCTIWTSDRRSSRIRPFCSAPSSFPFRTQEDLVGLRERGRGPPAWGVTDGSGPITFIVPLCQGRNPSPLAGGEGLGDQIRLNAQGGSQGLPPWWRPFGAPPGELVRGRDPWRRGNSSFST